MNETSGLHGTSLQSGKTTTLRALEKYLIELKIWHGSEYNERREKQLTDYLDYYHKDKVLKVKYWQYVKSLM